MMRTQSNNSEAHVVPLQESLYRLLLALGENMPKIVSYRTRQGSGRKLLLKPAGHFISGDAI